MSTYRTHTCNEISLEDVGKRVKIARFVETIKNVIAFPMNSKAQDLMMGAPGNVTKEQLREVHIKLDIKE